MFQVALVGGGMQVLTLRRTALSSSRSAASRWCRIMTVLGMRVGEVVWSGLSSGLRELVWTSSRQSSRVVWADVSMRWTLEERAAFWRSV